MTPDANQILRIMELAERVGLPAAHGDADVEILDPIRCAGRLLPPSFTWFCARYPGHKGWPYIIEPGLFSPFADSAGGPSDIELRNAWRREQPDWPAHLVSFSGTDDGDYCFAYDDEQGEHEPHVVYVDDWANPPSDDDTHAIRPARVADNFVDWLTGQVEWLLSSSPRKQDYEDASNGHT